MGDNVNNTLRQLSHKKRTVSDLVSFLSNKCEDLPNYSLLIGAGCSVTSGVDSGGALIKKWRKEIFEAENSDGLSEEEFWKNQYEWYDSRNPYSSLFQKKYDLPRQRRIFVEKQVAKKDPSIGYAYLVKLIEEKYFNTVFTTNFDDLLYEAFYRFSTERPIVCAHDSSISSITITSSRPKIIKLHGDYLFDDIKSSLRETESLDDNMKRKFIEFAKDHGLVVVGYAGNDRSIMDILSMLLQSNEYFKHGIYWCIREGEETLSEDLRHLLWKDRVYYVPIKGFDELMSTLNHSLTHQLPINTQMLSSEHHKELIGKLTNNKYIDSLKENPFIKKDIDELNKIVASNIVNDFFKYISLKKIDEDEPVKKSHLRKLSKWQRESLAKLNTLREEEKFEELKKQVDSLLDEVEDKGQYACRLLELKAKALKNLRNRDVKEVKETYEKLVSLDPLQEGYYLDAFSELEGHSEKMEFINSAIDKFTSDYYLYNKKANYLLQYAREMRYEDEYASLLQQIESCINKSFEYNSSKENDAILNQCAYLKLKAKDSDEVVDSISSFVGEKADVNSVMYSQIVADYYKTLKFSDNKAEQILKDLCERYRYADSPLKYEKCLLSLLSFYQEVGKKDEFRHIVQDYQEDFKPSLTFENFVLHTRLIMFGEIDEVEKTLVGKIGKRSDARETRLSKSLLFRLYCMTKNKDKVSSAFEALPNPSFDDRLDLLDCLDEYDKIIELLDEHWKCSPKTLEHICVYSYSLLQKGEYQKAYLFISQYYSKPSYADGVVYVNYFMAEMNYQHKTINDMKEKINKKILNHKEDFSKDVLISTYALLNQKNDLLRTIKQAQKSDALLKYRIKKWPVLKSFLKDEDVCELLK